MRIIVTVRDDNEIAKQTPTVTILEAIHNALTAAGIPSEAVVNVGFDADPEMAAVVADAIAWRSRHESRDVIESEDLDMLRDDAELAITHAEDLVRELEELRDGIERRIEAMDDENVAETHARPE